MALVSVRDVTVRFTDPPLLDRVNFQLEEKERVCLLGRNGTGKTTLMRIATGAFAPDGGEVVWKPGIRVAYLPQKVPHDLHGRAFDVVKTGLSDFDKTRNAAEADEEWKREQQVEMVLSQLQLDGETEVSVLSAGWKRRVLLARGLVRNPQVLLLDEPTNHLDIESIEWLETFLARYAGTLLFVTHDRMLSRRLSTRVLEIDRGDLFSWDCGYEEYLQRKEAALQTEEKQWEKFDKKMAQEEEWLRNTPKARRTRNEGRKRKVLQMREERRRRKAFMGDVKFSLQEAQKSGDLVIESKNLSFSYAENSIVNDFSTTIMRGEKIGVIGPNGSGKTTLLKLLLKQLEPNAGTVRHGTKLEIAYFDQLRAQLNEEESVFDNVGAGTDRIEVNGKVRHVISYLEDFLFTPERARSPIKILSGGERNRVLLAKLFTFPANVLVLDEPTNDLDAETLELLENLLVEFAGTILLVSHDRMFLNNVVTSTIAMEGNGEVNEYVGGYDDWLRQRKEQKAESKEKRVQEKKQAEKPKAAKRLSYNEKRELQAKHKRLEQLPQDIEQIEEEKNELQQKMAEPEFFKQPYDQVAQVQNRLEELENELEQVYSEWEVLEELFSQVDLKDVW